MNVLKSKINKNILKISPIILEQKCLMRLLNTKKTTNPILMSYASYESTNSSVANEPPMIVIHGLFGSKGNWNSLCKALQSKSNPVRKIIAVDARNHGDSPHISSHTYEDIAADIKHFMEVQKIPKAILMGHSMGGKAVMCVALKYPEIVDKLIVVDISPVSKSPNHGYLYGFFDQMRKIKIEPDVSLSQARITADTLLSKIVTDKGVRAFLLTNLVRKTDGSYGWRINIPTLMTHFEKIAGFPNLSSATYNGSTLFIIGAMSDFVQKNDRLPIKALFPKVEFVSVPNAGHWVHSEKPNEFLEHVLKFINNKD